MKYRGVEALPSSVALWLEQQLEERGIDRVVYSRYIFNLLQRNELSDGPLIKNIEIEALVNQLWVKLREAKDGNFLKEKTNSEDIFNLQLPIAPPDLSNKYYSPFPTVPKEYDNYFQNSIWTRSCNRRFIKQESPKCSKRKENKENVCGVIRSRMRSRSTVKQSGGSHHKMRSSAKSLDRKDDEAVVRYVKNEMKGRKCLNFFSDETEATAAKLSRTPGRREKTELNEFDQDLPMDFQQLLKSPDDSSFYKHPKPSQPQSNFIQSGTNLTNSIWSERMEEEEVPVWEMNKWSDARSSILSSAWKLPFDYEKDVESTDLSLVDEGSFFSFFGQPNQKRNNGYTIFQDDKKTLAPKVLNEIQSEQLVTSTNTHFRPIKHDPETEPQSQGYIDGSTFLISTSFEHIEYQRSESGGLYLDAEHKYQEFRRTDLTSPPTEGCFIPKFRVSLNEKFCQTDEDDDDKPLDEDVDLPLSNFYFPGDDQLAEDMLNSGGEEEEDQQPAIQVSGWVTTWPVSDSSGIWSNNTQDTYKPWILKIGSPNEFATTNSDNEILDGKNEHYTRLRNELTEEGEELMSDLSSIHLFLNPERMDDSNPLIQPHSPIMHIQPCPIENLNISNEKTRKKKAVMK